MQPMCIVDHPRWVTLTQWQCKVNIYACKMVVMICFCYLDKQCHKIVWFNGNLISIYKYCVILNCSNGYKCICLTLDEQYRPSWLFHDLGLIVRKLLATLVNYWRKKCTLELNAMLEVTQNQWQGKFILQIQRI